MNSAAGALLLALLVAFCATIVALWGWALLLKIATLTALVLGVVGVVALLFLFAEKVFA